MLFLTCVGSACAYCGVLSFRPNAELKYERPAVVTQFIDSLSTQEKATLRAILEDTSATKAEGWTKLFAFLNGLSLSKKVRYDPSNVIVPPYELKEEGLKVFNLLIGVRTEQLAEEKRDLPELSEHIDRVLVR